MDFKNYDNAYLRVRFNELAADTTIKADTAKETLLMLIRLNLVHGSRADSTTGEG